MSNWIEWDGGECPVSDGAVVQVELRGGDRMTGAFADEFWRKDNSPGDIVAYRVVSDAPAVDPQRLTGGKLAGNHYYRVDVPEPMSHEVKPYVAECADIIETLGMTFNEGEAFKAIWRLAASRQGRGKPGNQPVYDADKAAHYGARIAAQVRRGA
jgi:hypothetical protein